MNRSTALCSALALPDQAGAPDWLHLLPAGEVRTVDGRGPYRVADGAKMIATSLQATGGKLPIDENHSTDLAAPKGGAAPARGWIVDLQNRADGLWGKVEWTGEGRRIVEDRQYRGLSPAIVHDKAGRIHAVVRASLTNTPNLTGLTALHSQENTMDLRTALIEAMGLDSGADDAAIIAACKAMKDKMAAPDAKAVATALQSALQPIGALVGAGDDADAAAVLAGVQRLAAGAGQDEVVTALQSELATVTTRLNTAIDGQARDKATGFVDGAIALGRVGVKPMRDRYIAMHMADPTGTAELVNALPAIKGGATLTGQPAPSTDGLTQADEQVIALMGIDRAAYIASRGDLQTEAL